jgi:hypothetical protein
LSIPSRKNLDIDFRIDVLRHARQYFGFRLAHRRHHGADLAIEIDDIEGIEIGDMEGADAKPRQRQ